MVKERDYKINNPILILIFFFLGGGDKKKGRGVDLPEKM